MTELTAAARGRSMTDDEQRDFDAAASQVVDLDRQISAAESDLERTASTSISRADASEIAKLCAEGGVPTMAAALLTEGVTVAQARERVGAAGQIRDLVALARRKDPSLPEDLAATMVTEGKTVEQARAALFDKLVAAEEKTAIRSHPPALEGNAGVTASASSMERELRRAGLKKDA
ncbi:hypothetical protein [Methylobacterium sp. WSM2598]|uniref:hypothetical protein n=1 Tax=Methylobacterium sp. WSM2598 TaxID=398261 RepID=UPI00037A1FC3|nr:hypothetical protein [Methylobacterium sp. WSM2598]